MLWDGALLVWDSLAIVEHSPSASRGRALARRARRPRRRAQRRGGDARRLLGAAGGGALRSAEPRAARARRRRAAISPASSPLSRRRARAFGAGGPFLFGAPTSRTRCSRPSGSGWSATPARGRPGGARLGRRRERPWRRSARGRRTRPRPHAVYRRAAGRAPPWRPSSPTMTSFGAVGPGTAPPIPRCTRSRRPTRAGPRVLRGRARGRRRGRRGSGPSRAATRRRASSARCTREEARGAGVGGDLLALAARRARASSATGGWWSRRSPSMTAWRGGSTRPRASRPAAAKGRRGTTAATRSTAELDALRA